MTAESALSAVRDNLTVRMIAAKPIRNNVGLGWMDGMKEAVACIDVALARLVHPAEEQ